MALALDIHQTQGEGIADHAGIQCHFTVKAANTPKEHVTVFRQLENLVLTINERRQNDSKAALNLYIADK